MNKEISLIKNLGEIGKTLQKQIDKLGETFMEDFPKIEVGLSRAIPNLLEAIEELKIRMPASLVELSKYGWYINLEVAPVIFIELMAKIKAGDPEYVDGFLTSLYEKDLDVIEKRILHFAPNRKDVIKEAFGNHRKGKYASSIVLMLTQIDGLCYDNFKKLYFRNNPEARREGVYKPEIESELKKGAGIISEWFLEVISNSRGIDDHSKNVGNYPIRLNRHEIIHGIDYNYGTKINSLKIISLLSFICDLVFGNKLKTVGKY